MLDHTWRYGICLGRALHSDSNFIGLNDGSIVTARAMVRVIPQNRWCVQRMHAIAGVPGVHRAAFDSIEAEPEPHAFASSEMPVDSDEQKSSIRRRLKITLKDLGRYGFSKNCPKCRFHSRNRHALAHKEHHT